MADQRAALAAMDDQALEGALRDLSTALAYPSAERAAADIATRVRQRIAAAPGAPSAPAARWAGSRAGRSVAASSSPSPRCSSSPRSPARSGSACPGSGSSSEARRRRRSPRHRASSATPGALGQVLGLGTRLPLDEAERLAGIDSILPTDPAIGPPDGAFLLANRVALVWPERPGLPADPSSGVGLLISEFRGEVTQGIYDKYLDSDAQLTPVTVNGNRGYWISGPPHFFAYVDPNGRVVEDSRRVVGDTLIWADGDVTYRLESRVGMEEAIRLAESLR